MSQLLQRRFRLHSSNKNKDVAEQRKSEVTNNSSKEESNKLFVLANNSDSNVVHNTITPPSESSSKIPLRRPKKRSIFTSHPKSTPASRTGETTSIETASSISSSSLSSSSAQQQQQQQQQKTTSILIKFKTGRVVRKAPSTSLPEPGTKAISPSNNTSPLNNSPPTLETSSSSDDERQIITSPTSGDCSADEDHPTSCSISAVTSITAASSSCSGSLSSQQQQPKPQQQQQKQQQQQPSVEEKEKGESIFTVVPFESLVEEEKEPIVQLILSSDQQETTIESSAFSTSPVVTGAATAPSVPTLSLTVEQTNKIIAAIQALDQSGNEYFERGLYEEAYKRYERAFTLKQRTLNQRGTTAPSIVSTCTNEHDDDERQHEPSSTAAGESYLRLGPVGESLNLNCGGTSSIPSTSNNINPTDDHTKTILASVATSINNLTYLKQRSGAAGVHETMASYVKSLQIKREVLGPDHLSVGKTLNNIGSVFYLSREYQPALVAYQDAHRIMAAALGEDSLDVATVLSNIGDVYCCLCDRVKALDYYRRALNIRWTLLGPTDPKVVRLMEQTAMLELKLVNGGLTQPIGPEESESEDEEFLQEDRDKQLKYMEDVNELKNSVRDDLDYFDWMERQATLDFLQEKAMVYQEIQNLYDMSESSRYSSSHHTLVEDCSDGGDDDQNETIIREVPQHGAACATEFSLPNGALMSSTEDGDDDRPKINDRPNDVFDQQQSLHEDHDVPIIVQNNEEHTIDAAEIVDHPAMPSNTKHSPRRTSIPTATTIPVAHRSYMEPTASSVARSKTVMNSKSKDRQISKDVASVSRSSQPVVISPEKQHNKGSTPLKLRITNDDRNIRTVATDEDSI